MIAAVSMGRSVDSEIHYVTAFLRLRRSGRNVADSLYAVQQSVGRAAFIAALALMVGFGSLCLSEFVPTIYFGALVSITIAVGLVGDLLLLPVLLYVTAPRDNAAASCE